MEITTNEGLCIVVDETLPYEPSNYVWEDYIHVGHLKGQDSEYPLYTLSASGDVEVQDGDTCQWTKVGTWNPPEHEPSGTPEPVTKYLVRVNDKDGRCVVAQYIVASAAGVAKAVAQKKMLLYYPFGTYFYEVIQAPKGWDGDE